MSVYLEIHNVVQSRLEQWRDTDDLYDVSLVTVLSENTDPANLLAEHLPAAFLSDGGSEPDSSITATVSEQGMQFTLYLDMIVNGTDTESSVARGLKVRAIVDDIIAGLWHVTAETVRCRLGTVENNNEKISRHQNFRDALISKSQNHRYSLIFELVLPV